MKKKLITLALCLIATTVLFGCSLEETKEEKTETTKMKDKYEKMSYILDKTYEKINENVLYSPLSLDMALGMTDAGAGGNTKKELDTYLGKDNYPDYAGKYIKWMKNYEGVEIANSVWVDKKSKIKTEFKNNVKENFKADIESADFKNKTETVNNINNWSNEKTHGMIPQIINKDFIKDDSKAILVNSLYFESAWDNKFKLTEKDFTFTKFDNSKQVVDKLSDKEYIYYENKKATAFAKDYENGITFIGILPKKEGEFNVSDLDIKSLLKSKTDEYDVIVEMPKLEYDSTCAGLVETLKELGVITAFDQEDADFREMIELKNNENLYISDIVQKCKIELNEEKTKAAATTVVGMGMCTSVAPTEEPEVKEVILDRPFAYLIYDKVNDEVLFIGKVVDVE